MFYFSYKKVIVAYEQIYFILSKKDKESYNLACESQQSVEKYTIDWETKSWLISFSIFMQFSEFFQ